LKTIDNLQIGSFVSAYQHYLNGLAPSTFFELDLMANSKITEFEFIGCALTGLIANGSEFVNCIFRDVNLEDMYLNLTKFKGCTFSSCSFIKSQMMKTEFITSKFENSRFFKADMGDETINNCLFVKCDFRGARLSRYKVIESTFVDCLGMPADISNISIDRPTGP